MANFFKMTIFFFLCCLFNGCAHPPKPPALLEPISPQQWQQTQQKLLALTHWQAQGRLAISQSGKGANASFIWQQHGKNYQLKLFGPFGAGAIQLIGGPNGVELREANGKITRAPTPELLLQQRTRLTLPLKGLFYWLRGIPLPETLSQGLQFDQQGRLLKLQQEGWHIDYQSYLPDNSLPLPNKLSLQNGPIKVKIIVTSWKIPAH